MARARRIVEDSSDDEFPDVRDLGSWKSKASAKSSSLNAAIVTPAVSKLDRSTKNTLTVRRRKLGAITDNPLLRPIGGSLNSLQPQTPCNVEQVRLRKSKSTTPQRIELRTRKTKPAIRSFEIDSDHSDAESIQEETIVEDFSEDDDGSEFQDSGCSDFEADDSACDEIFQRSPSKLERAEGEAPRERKRSTSPSAQLLAEALEADERYDSRGSSVRRAAKPKKEATTKKAENIKGPPLTNSGGHLSKLQLFDLPPQRTKKAAKDYLRPATPTSPPPEPKPTGLASPSKKIPRIPATPHHVQTDTFWDQEFVDEWNDEHSPKKQLFLPSEAAKNPSKKPGSRSLMKKGEPSQAAVQKATKKAFSQSKHEAADRFLQELDERVTKGQLSGLSASTGGIRIEWTNKLHTTAGRANWKRETIKNKAHASDGGETTVSVRYRHHASIELAEKVIDDQNRLLNVIAHEFCHLANFMVSGVTTNPHGREFKSWAAKVTREFGDRGIEVTTKHSYDIDFKYVWECTSCALEFKRHSKSIYPERHRCGACKSELKQTKPVPRGKPAKESEYQKFMKEQMKIIKKENPGIPQKDIMKLVASRWAQREKDKANGHEDDLTGSSTSFPQSRGGSSIVSGKEKVEGMTKFMGDLTIVDLT